MITATGKKSLLFCKLIIKIWCLVGLPRRYGRWLHKETVDDMAACLATLLSLELPITTGVIGTYLIERAHARKSYHVWLCKFQTDLRIPNIKNSPQLSAMVELLDAGELSPYTKITDSRDRCMFKLAVKIARGRRRKS